MVIEGIQTDISDSSKEFSSQFFYCKYIILREKPTTPTLYTRSYCKMIHLQSEMTLLNSKIYEILILTCVSNTTVTILASRRLLQPVHEETTTVSYKDVITPPAAVVDPVVAHFSWHHSIMNRRMSSSKPTCGSGTAVVWRNTLFWHTISRQANKSVPLCLQ